MSSVSALRGGGAGPYEDLCEAIREGDLEVVKSLLAKGVRVNPPVPQEDGPLHLAIKCGACPDIVALLLEKGADVSQHDEDDELPLMLAIESQNVDAALMILEHGADVYVVDGEGSTPLHRAAALGLEEIARVLVDKELFLDIEDSLHYTALHLAAKNGREGIVRMLLGRGANFHEADRHGRTALHHAATGGHYDIACRLIDYGADVNAADLKGRAPLHDAAWLGHTDIVLTLLNFNSDINVRDGEGFTPLHHAAVRGHEDIVLLLMERGAGSSIPDKSGRTPLHHVILRGNYEMIKMLIERSDDLDTLDSENNTPLTSVLSGTFSTTVSLLDKDPEMSELLVKHFVRTKMKNGLVVTDDDFLGLKIHLSDERWSELCSYFKKCAKEMTRLRTYRVMKDSISLYDFLTKKVQVLEKYARNEDALRLLPSDEWEDDFPIYSDFIRVRAQRAILKSNLHLLAGNCLRTIAISKAPQIGDLPHIPCHMILNDMTELDLRNFINACFHPPD